MMKQSGGPRTLVASGDARALIPEFRIQCPALAKAVLLCAREFMRGHALLVG